MFEIFEMYNIIVYSIYLYIHILYVEMFSFFWLSHFSHFTVLLVLLESCMHWFEDPGLPEWKLWIWWTIGIRNHGRWNAQFLIEFETQFLVFNFDRYGCCGVARWHHGFVLRKKDMQKNPKKHNFGWRWSSILPPRGHQRSKLLFFFYSSENKLGTLHVVELFSIISVDLQAQWQLQLDTSALVPGHDGQSMSLVLNLCYNSALRALQVFFFTFVFCCHCLHPFRLLETRFVIVLSDLDSGQHYKLCLDMDGVSTALLPGQHSTQELRSEFCFFQYLKFKVFFPKIVFFLLIFFSHNSHIFQACLCH